MTSIQATLKSSFEHYEKTFKALADEKRLQIMYILANAPRYSICVCDLMEIMGMAQSKLSYHLKVLFQANLITQEKRGTWNYYSLNDSELNTVLSEDLCCLFRKSNNSNETEKEDGNACSC